MKKVISFILTLAMSAMVFSGCGNTESGGSSAENSSSGPGEESSQLSMQVEPDTFPITETPLAIDMGRATFLGRFENIKEMWKTKDYEKLTGMTVNVKEYPETGWQEQIQIELATGNVQDAYYQIGFTSSQIFEYSQSGLFIPLDDLIAQYAPNFNKILTEHPEIRQAIQMPDGHIYSLPFIEGDVLTGSNRAYLNQYLMEEAGISEVPKTIDELTAYLTAVKEKNPDMYPVAMQKGNFEHIVNGLMGAYGIGTAGLKGIDSLIDKGLDGKVRFIPSSDQYKELLQLLAGWYDAGLINPESFTTIDVPKMRNLGENDELAMFIWPNSALASTDAEIRTHWTAVSQFEGPNGDRLISSIDAPVRQPYGFVITNKNENPIETIRWVDYFYGEEGYIYQQVGREGESFALNSDGKYEFIGEAKTLNDEGKISYYVGNHGSGYPLYNNNPDYSDKSRNIYNDLRTDGRPAWQRYQIAEDDDYMDILPDEIWPEFTSTKDEAEEIGTIFTDIQSYVSEMQDKFITGAVNIDAEWENYLSTLDRLNVADYLEIRQTQYERYSSN